TDKDYELDTKQIVKHEDKNDKAQTFVIEKTKFDINKENPNLNKNKKGIKVLPNTGEMRDFKMSILGILIIASILIILKKYRKCN
ncbi:TPA: LPXTG cell wall anchor domain-containing protein, partial [Clostridium perfringens]|nr:LPXTG cell wall anchor domain-containing protein [Clostridium perfringens]HAT4368446.1 LPXTG cell wall anchor domain-containing protein [Clostridium perfringens]